jgi:hypothetical protein
MSAIEEEKAVEVLIIDGVYIDSETGEVIGMVDNPVPDAPDHDGVMEEIAQWVGERRAYHIGKAEGLKAEKQVWLDKINARFNADIKRHEQSVEWIENQYRPSLLNYARRKLEGAKKRSLGVGLLVLQLVKTRARTTVIDNDKAAEWAWLNCEDALKCEVSAKGNNAMILRDAAAEAGIGYKETVLVSEIPDELKAVLTPDNSGIEFNPGGVDELRFN